MTSATLVVVVVLMTWRTWQNAREVSISGALSRIASGQPRGLRRKGGIRGPLVVVGVRGSPRRKPTSAVCAGEPADTARRATQGHRGRACLGRGTGGRQVTYGAILGPCASVLVCWNSGPLPPPPRGGRLGRVGGGLFGRRRANQRRKESQRRGPVELGVV